MGSMCGEGRGPSRVEVDEVVCCRQLVVVVTDSGRMQAAC